MRWVDNDSYFGPDRRERVSLRLYERRRHDDAGAPPPLGTALRQLRLRVLDARGPGVDAFVSRVHGTALLAEMQNEPDVAIELNALGSTLAGSHMADVRVKIYKSLDRAHAMMRAA